MPDLREFLLQFNETMSQVAEEFQGRFAATASPTFNKQETITFLYQRIHDDESGCGAGRVGVLRTFGEYMGMLARLLTVYTALLFQSLYFRVKALPTGIIYVRTWLVPRSVDERGVKDEYFRGLIDDLRRVGPVIVGFQPLGLRQPLHGFRRADRNSIHIIPVGLLSVAEVTRLVIEYFRSGRVRVKKAWLFRGVNITPAINRSLALDYLKLRSFQAYLDRAVAEKLRGFKPRAILYIFENQAWEHGYLEVIDRQITRILAYQSSGFSFRFLNFFPSTRDACTREFPDAVLCVGELHAKVLQEYGHYPVPLIPFAALRFDYPVEGGLYRVDSPRKEIYRRVLYAFAVHKYQYKKIVDDLKRAFKGSKVEVVLKFHPLFRVGDLMVDLPANFRLWGASDLANGSFVETYDAVIFNDNSFGIESLILGVKTFEYVCEKLYCEQRLLQFHAYEPRLDAEGLCALRCGIENGSFDKSYPVEEIQRYVNSVYKPYTQRSFQQICDLLGQQVAA